MENDVEPYDFNNKFDKYGYHGMILNDETIKIPFDLKSQNSSIRLNSFYGLSVDAESVWNPYDSTRHLFKSNRRIFLRLKKQLEGKNENDDAVNFMAKFITAKINNYVVQANERKSHTLNDANFETFSAKVQLCGNPSKYSRKYWTIMDTRTDADKSYHKINKIINERTDTIYETSSNVL